MSYTSYKLSTTLSTSDPDWYVLLILAKAVADPNQQVKMNYAFPTETYAEHFENLWTLRQIGLYMTDIKPDFEVLLFAMIRKADSLNMSRLETYFPELVAEFKARYDAPGGALNQTEARELTKKLVRSGEMSKKDAAEFIASFPA